MTDTILAHGLTGRLFSRFSEARAQWRAERAHRALYLRTLHELQVLSDRDLADIGIARSEIRAIARDAADRG